jgi:hypothetical protein
LAQALASWVSDRVPTPVAVHTARGGQLTPDAGAVLRDTPAAADLATWETMVAAYARLQRDLAYPHSAPPRHAPTIVHSPNWHEAGLAHG